MIENILYNIITNPNDDLMANSMNDFSDVARFLSHPNVMIVCPGKFSATRDKIRAICSPEVLESEFFSVMGGFYNSNMTAFDYSWNHCGTKSNCAKRLFSIWIDNDICDALILRYCELVSPSGERAAWARHCVGQLYSSYYLLPHDDKVSEWVKNACFDINPLILDHDRLRSFYRQLPRYAIDNRFFKLLKSGTAGMKHILLSREDATKEEILVGIQVANRSSAHICAPITKDIMDTIDVKKRAKLLESITGYKQYHIKNVVNMTKDQVKKSLFAYVNEDHQLISKILRSLGRACDWN